MIRGTQARDPAFPQKQGSGIPHPVHGANLQNIRTMNSETQLVFLSLTIESFHVSSVSRISILSIQGCSLLPRPFPQGVRVSGQGFATVGAAVPRAGPLVPFLTSVRMSLTTLLAMSCQGQDWYGQ